MKPSESTTVVIDVGGRYGMHPSWSGFAGDLLYLAFEPDPQEAERLRLNNTKPGFEVVDLALDKQAGERDFISQNIEVTALFIRLMLIQSGLKFTDQEKGKSNQLFGLKLVL
jgi:hypothetical protein